MNIPEQIEEIRVEDIPVMALHAQKEANPLYPVPRIMFRKELAGLYYAIAGGYDKKGQITRGLGVV